MAEWTKRLPKDGETIEVGDPGHPGMHNDAVACIVELRDAVDAIPAPTAAPTADTLSGATATGKSVMKAADAAAARTAIGAGTGSSNLALGTTSTTAKAGDYVPAYADVTGKPATFAPTIGTTATTAAAGNHVHAASVVTTTAIDGVTGNNVQAVLADLAARVAVLEAASE